MAAEIKVQDLNEPVHSKVHDDSLARKDHLNIFPGKIRFRVKCTIFTANCERLPQKFETHFDVFNIYSGPVARWSLFSLPLYLTSLGVKRPFLI